MTPADLASELVTEADASGSSRKLGGCWLVTSAELIAEQAGWDDGDASKAADFTLYPYWIITDGGVDPIGVSGPDDGDLQSWCSQYIPDSPSVRVTRSRAKAIKSGARMVQVILRDSDSIASLDRLTDEHGSVTAAVTAALKR